MLLTASGKRDPQSNEQQPVLYGQNKREKENMLLATRSGKQTTVRQETWFQTTRMIKLYNALRLRHSTRVSCICFLVTRHTHLPLCCSNTLCSVLSQTLSRDASPQRRGHRQRSLCQERRESPCSSKVPCLIPGQRGHGPQSSHGDCAQTTCKHTGTVKDAAGGSGRGSRAHSTRC